MTRSQNVAIVGQGYVGLPLAMCGVAAGHHVVGIDSDERKVAGLRDGVSHVEDITDALVADALAGGRYRPTSSYDDAAGFDVAVITVPTPLQDGLPDVSHIETAVRQLAPQLRRGALVVLESTTYPGTTDEMVAPLLAELTGLSAGADFLLGYSPERIDPGNPQWHIGNTPKIVSGIDARSLAAVDEFYSGLVDVTVPVASTRQAELAKLLENTFRHINIALVNEIAVFAHQMDIDIWGTIDAAATKPYGFMKFVPGPGVGGHCLPVDPSYLSWQVRRTLGRSSRFIELANDVNNHMPDYVVQRLIEGLNRREKSLRGSRIVVLGASYKRNSADLRESPTIRILELLKQFDAVVTVVDPLVAADALPAHVARADLTESVVRGADAVLIAVAHEVFDFDFVQRHAAYILDTQRVTDGPATDLL